MVHSIQFAMHKHSKAAMKYFTYKAQITLQISHLCVKHCVMQRIRENTYSPQLYPTYPGLQKHFRFLPLPVHPVAKLKITNEWYNYFYITSYRVAYIQSQNAKRRVTISILSLSLSLRFYVFVYWLDNKYICAAICVLVFTS